MIESIEDKPFRKVSKPISSIDEEAEEKRGLKLFLSFLFFLLVVGLLLFYWFIPLGDFQFVLSSPGHSNFSDSSSSGGVQFYENMRFPSKEISYNIIDCPLQRTNDMEKAFEVISNLTILSFYPSSSDEEITINCEEAAKVKRGLFIAGEGGPTNITRAGKFSVITEGQILLLRDSVCTNPNVAIHELLHSLGFDHSNNRNNIMYNITNCRQVIGEDLISLIDDLYTEESLPDLTFENVEAGMSGRYLNTNISIRNNGLADSGDFKLIIYADEKKIKEVEINEILLGYGRVISLSNIRVSQISVDELEYSIESSFSELDKKNNKIELKIKSD